MGCSRIFHRQQRVYRYRLIVAMLILKDFWEYDPATNAWTQKADFGGTARYGAVGFSIGSKGYIGTGSDLNGTFKKISGNMILPPMPGHRKPTSGEQEEGCSWIFHRQQRVYRYRAYCGSVIKISGNMILPPMPGHRKPTLGGTGRVVCSRIFHRQQRVYRYRLQCKRL